MGEQVPLHLYEKALKKQKITNIFFKVLGWIFGLAVGGFGVYVVGAISVAAWTTGHGVTLLVVIGVMAAIGWACIAYENSRMVLEDAKLRGVVDE